MWYTSCVLHTLWEEDVHGDEDNCDSDAEIDGEGMPKQGSWHEACEDGGHRGGILLQYGVSILEEEGWQNALQGVVDYQKHGHLQLCKRCDAMHVVPRA